MRTTILAVITLLLSSLAHGQGMIPDYVFTMSDAFSNNNQTITVGETVEGSTNCTPPTCDGAQHYITMRATMGSVDNVLYTPDFNPTTYVIYDEDAGNSVPLTDAKANLHAEVNCTVRGPGFSTDYPQTVENDQWETQITFFKSEAPQFSIITPICQVAGDTSPDWNDVLTNPVGTQTWPLYFQAIQLAYSPSSQPPQGHWVGFPYYNGHSNGGETGTYGIYGWYHLNGGAPGPMPHVCTQNQIGKTTYNPPWTPNPQ